MNRKEEKLSERRKSVMTPLKPKERLVAWPKLKPKVATSKARVIQSDFGDI